MLLFLDQNYILKFITCQKREVFLTPGSSFLLSPAVVLFISKPDLKQNLVLHY